MGKLQHGDKCFVAIISKTSRFGSAGEIFTCVSEVGLCEGTFCGWSEERHSEVEINSKKYSSRWNKDKILAISSTKEGAWEEAKKILADKIESVAHCVFASGSNLRETCERLQKKHNEAIDAFSHCKDLAQKLKIPMPERHLYRTVLAESSYELHSPPREPIS